MSGESKHIVCPHCNSVNRIPGEKDARKAICGHCHQALFPGGPSSVTAAQFATQIERNDIPVVVDFWAAWCGPCKAMAPAYERVASELEPALRFLKVDTEAEPELSARFNIRSIPTVMLFQKGKVVAQQAGAMGAEGLRSWLRQHAAPASRT
jgi:thioredoxin 2